MTRGVIWLAAAVTVMTAAPAPLARAQGAPGALHLLDVPYLPQSEALCGGAAVAMVMRYWGATGVYAETFAPLVDARAGGITGQKLLDDLHTRGWTAQSLRGDAAFVQRELAARRPVITLIEDRPSRYHYVVIVGWANGRVILHDPARAPFRVLDEAAFVRAWEPSGFWTMIATRGTDRAGVPASAPPVISKSEETNPCRGLVDEGVRLANRGDVGEARSRFDLAATSCPDSPAPWRERAGLHALGERWGDAAADARAALSRDPNDEQASRILATALYIEGDTRGALAAWNALGEPRVDIVNVKGLARTRFTVAADAIGIAPGALLTREALDRAARRLDELPAAQTTRVTYQPAETGRGQIDAVVIERPLAPTAPIDLAVVGVRAITDRELAVTIASPTGGGEAWHGAWRWWEHRPRVAVGLDAPSPFGGTWGIEAAYERQTYGTSEAFTEETRRNATFHVSDWTARSLRWQVSAGLDSFGGTRGMTAGGDVEQRFLDDRVSLTGGIAMWTGAGSAWTTTLRGNWRNTTRNEGTAWLAGGGVALAGDRAPLALWPGAGTGQGRDSLLRAHPLLDDGVIGDAVFGRRLVNANVEWRGWRSIARGLVKVAPAAFVDTGRATRGFAGTNDRWQVDAGAGLRIAVPGSGIVRIDLARGLRDGGFVFSAGWTR